MVNRTMLTMLFIISALVTLAFPRAANACGTASKETDPELLVQNSEMIVRAAAVGYGDPPPPDSRVRFIEFRVEEVLKGGDVPDIFLIRGILTDEDDFNNRPVPYDYVRPAGRVGSCSARHYKQGAEFLLFLKRHDPNDTGAREWGDVTPYWAPMAATNEQLRSSDDAWLRWVKGYLEKVGGGPKNVNTFRQHGAPHNSFDRTRNQEAFTGNVNCWNVNCSRVCSGGGALRLWKC